MAGWSSRCPACLFGHQAEAGRHQLHGLGQAGGAGDVTGLQVLFGALAAQRRPRVTGSGASGEPWRSSREQLVGSGT
jgi:hypothetical protein